MTLREEVAGRRYYRNEKLGGRLSPSVSTIIWRTASEDMVPWAANQAARAAVKSYRIHPRVGTAVQAGKAAPDFARNEAAHVGTRVHELAWEPELWADEDHKEIVTALNSWAFFLAESGAVRVSDEVEMAGVIDEHDRIGYGGTYDAVIQLPDDRRVLIDLKTSRLIHPPTALQLAAYEHLLEEPADEAWVVHLNKFYLDFGIQKVNLPRAWDAFKAAHRLYGLLTDDLWEV